MRSNELDTDVLLTVLTCVHRGTKALASRGNRASPDPRERMDLWDFQANQDSRDLLELQALQDKMDPQDIKVDNSKILKSLVP